MFDFLPNSIIPWLLGGLLLLAFFTLSVTIKSWRESKRSPYFFLRIQAGKKMQRYMVASLVLILLAAATSAYAWQVPEESPPLVALIKHAKPQMEAPEAAQDSAVDVSDSPEAITVSLTPGEAGQFDTAAPDLLAPVSQPITLPESYDQLEPENELSSDTQLGSISFSLDVSDDYQAINPTNRFVEGFFTVYATFSYQGMSDGMSWSWVWQRNGQTIEGGNQVWSYGQEGPGYIFFRPEEGFSSGQYALTIWVNGEVQSQASFTVSEGISATN